MQVTVQNDLSSDSQMKAEDASWSSNCIEDVSIHYASDNAIMELLGMLVSNIN